MNYFLDAIIDDLSDTGISDAFVVWWTDNMDESEVVIISVCPQDIEDCYTASIPSQSEDSLIKYIINKLNECTHFENDKWCELFVLSTIESHGVTSSYSYWEPPQFIVENLLKDLCEFNTSLISI